MSPTTGTAVLIIVAFVLPGFLALTLRERADVVPVAQSPFERLLSALLYSVLVYALVLGFGLLALDIKRSFIVDLWHGREALKTTLGVGVFVLLVTPALVAEAGVLWRRSSRVRPRVLKALGVSRGHAVHSAWNQAFGTLPEDVLLRVVCRDGKVVAGQWGGGSMSGYSEHQQDLYLRPQWELSDDDDQWFVSAITGSRGIWLGADEIARVEIYDPGGDSFASHLGEGMGAVRTLGTLWLIGRIARAARGSSSRERKMEAQ